MSTTEPPPATATATPTPAPSSSPPSNNVQPVTYVIIPLVTLASVFLVGLFAYLRRRRGRRLEAGSSSEGEGGEAQMQERRRDHGDATDRWPPSSLGLNWWFLRSQEGLNELGEAPPPYDVKKRRKAATEGSASATDEDAAEGHDVYEEDIGDGESRHSSQSIRESARQSVEDTRRSTESVRRSTELPRRSIEQQRHSDQERRSEEITQETSEEQHTRRSGEQLQETTEQTHHPGETPPEARHRRQDVHIPASIQEEPASDDGEMPLFSGRRRQTPEEIHALIEARRHRNQRRRERAAARTSAASSSDSTTDICSTEFFHEPSPERSRRRIERLNHRLRRLGYVTSDSSESYGFQLRDMEDGAAPPDYEREPEVAVPPPAQLPPPLPADAPPAYPMPIVRRREPERERETALPMVRQTQHDHFPHHNYLFMPPLEHDYLVTSFSASLDMPRHLHSRF